MRSSDFVHEIEIGVSRESLRTFLGDLHNYVALHPLIVSIDELEPLAERPSARRYRVIDRVRVDEANRLRDDRQARKVIKSARWLLLRNRSNLTRYEDRIRLQDLLAANKRLCTTYVLKDDLKHLWDYRYRGAALTFWKQWYRRAIYSKIEPLKKFARNLAKRIDGVLAHAQWHIGTSIIEGINNKIRLLSHRAFGFHSAAPLIATIFLCCGGIHLPDLQLL